LTIFLIGGLLFYNEKGYLKSKTVGLLTLTHAVALYPHQIWRGRLNSNKQTSGGGRKNETSVEK